MVFIIGHVIADPGEVIYKILRRTNNIKTKQANPHIPDTSMFLSWQRKSIQNMLGFASTDGRFSP